MRKGEDLGKLGLKELQKFKPSKINLNFSSLILSVAFFAVAALPHLFFLKYRDHVEALHKANITAISSEVNVVKSETSKYETYQAEMKSIEEQENRVSQRLNVVKQLQSSRTGPVNILDAIGQLLPQRVWLTNIDMTLSPTNQLQLTGLGYSSEDVAEFVDKLNSSIYLEKVMLDGVSTQKNGEQSGTVKSFLIYATPKSSVGN